MISKPVVRSSGLILLGVLGCAPADAPTPAPASDAWYPAPTGAAPVGVRDFEFVDTTYPTDRPEDMAGRRLMVRAWYPAGRATDRRRTYFEGGEREAFGDGMTEALHGLIPADLIDSLAQIVTWSRVDAPVAADPSRLPVVVYSHGGLSYVSQNTAIMEDLASHGYLVLSVAHPGGSVGVVFADGNVEAFSPQFRDAIFTLVGDSASGRGSPDLAVRYAAAEQLVDAGGLGPWAPRWRDDMIAVVDLIERGDHDDPSVAQLLGRADLERLAYAGMSYGASAATSAAQVDTRARAAVNFDGTHWLSDLLNVAARVPVLEMVSEPEGSLSNEFFFEPVATMGQNPHVLRVRLPNITHIELFDYMLLAQEYRASLPGGGQGDGRRVHDILVAMFGDFLGKYVLGHENGYPESTLARFPDARVIDMEYVREWAATRAVR